MKSGRIITEDLFSSWHTSSCLGLLFIFYISTSSPLFAEVSDNTQLTHIHSLKHSVAVFDVPYELFAALSEYHDLTQSEEKNHQLIDTEMIPVIEDIIYYFEEERKKYTKIEKKQQTLGMENEHIILNKVKENLKKMDAHLLDFRNELLFRKKAIEFRLLMKKQKALKDKY
ncbi:hypothetical protein QUF61_02155 [Candidatus Venteria ishoeyi]|uniref:hypothetical protein n=1 Tax=Candidatus Venteria ishoeyi TaxID=1899563 RepID=UPI0025A4EB99|nr:hypothetical protein [Candidatus Venteria ishoeyi]MDM8545274.1 hypothetical protein [Candidatus Venteria ishoeyi]